MTAKKTKSTFTGLVDSIRAIDEQLTKQAVKAVNISLTMRNWLIGMYIVEYEQTGKDRASYGDRLLERLSSALLSHRLNRVEERELRRYRQFYQIYPQIRESLTPELRNRLGRPFMAAETEKRESLTPEISLGGRELLSTNKLFVSKYQLELPKKEEMERFIREQVKEMCGQ